MQTFKVMAMKMTASWKILLTENLQNLKYLKASIYSCIGTKEKQTNKISKSLGSDQDTDTLFL